MPKVKNPPGLFTDRRSDQYSSLYSLLCWLNLAAGADYNLSSNSYQPDCSDKELDRAINAFEGMLTSLHFMTRDIGAMLALNSDNEEQDQYMLGVSYGINFIGSLSMDLMDVRDILQDAKLARASGRYVYQPSEGGDHE
ncbi:MAG: hypothetical protein ACU836_18780 [Gammaproteobacteria bacterium]